MKQFPLNIPNVITLFRIIASITFLPVLLIRFGAGLVENNYALALIYFLLGCTDTLDGKLARYYQQETLMGKLLDPLADKLFLFSTILAMVYLHTFAWYWALIVVSREFIVMSLREIALHYQFSLPVSSTAKIKTYFQVIFFTYALLNPVFFGSEIVYTCFLFNMIFFSLYSAFLYGRKVYTTLE